MYVKENKVDMFYGAIPKLFEFARHLRNNETITEKILWNKLRKNQLLGFRFHRQHPIHYFIADFYCHKTKLIIEVDGGVHLAPSQFEYDKNREYELNALGLIVLRFSNDEVLNNIGYVINKIKKTLINASPL